MREFNKISSKFWMTPLSQELKSYGSDAMLLSIYLQTNHHTHSLGVFYLPLAYIAHDTGVKLDVVTKIIKQLIELDYCRYDFKRHYIWIKDYALEQSGGPLKAGDNRVIQGQKYFSELPALCFIEEFYQAHGDDYHLPSPLKAPDKAPSEDLRSTETETKTETETQTETKLLVAPVRPAQGPKPIEVIFEHWKSIMHHPNAKLDQKRRKLISCALGWGYEPQQLCDAITGCSNTPHNVGDNDRGERYDGLHVIFRNADQIDRFLHNFHSPPKRLSKTEQSSKNTYHTLQDWMTEAQ